MDRIRIRGCGIRGQATVPGDKSISHRAAILGAMAAGTTRIFGYAPGEDCRSTLACMQALGAGVEIGPDEIVIESPGIDGWIDPADVLNAGNSGTTARLLAGVLAGSPVFAVITGDSSLRGRPMGRVVRPLADMGAVMLGRRAGDLLPLAIRGTKLRGIDYASEVASAQVKTALILAGLSAEGRSTIREPVRSRDHTERILPLFGAEITVGQTEIMVPGGQQLTPATLRVPGDFSTAAFLITAAVIGPDSELTIEGAGLNPTRTGLLTALTDMGADIEVRYGEPVGDEPVGTITARTSRLVGQEFSGARVVSMIDELPLLALVAAVADGETVIRDAGELRLKESDRIAATAGELTRLGARVSELPDGLHITGVDRLTGAAVSSRGDHRLAMMLSIAGLRADGETVVDGAGSAAVSFPGWWDVLQSLAPGSVIADG